MTRAPLRLGVLGGTLDPVHHGHLSAAHAAGQALALDAVWLMPSRVPAHKEAPHASPWHRFAMTALAVSHDDLLVASDLELARPGPTYTWDTLRALADEGFAPSQIFFITGADAFAGIETWHQFPELLDAANFAVVTRAGRGLAATVRTHPAVAKRLESTASALPTSESFAARTAIWLVEAQTPDVSSRAIRQRILAGMEVGADVPASVAGHIRRHGLYTHTPAARRLHGED